MATGDRRTKDDPTDDGLSSEQRRAIATLIVGGDDHAAASAAGVSARTIRRWRATPAFSQALALAERDAIGDASRLMARLTVTAARTAGRVLTSKTATDANKLRAATLVLQSTIALRSHIDLEDRIAALEAIADAQEEP